ncbi:MAG: ribosome silencing factor [Chlamydiia bacterium]|nr:ribosome silencing factor [Chlamydiia bacterium]
MIDDSRKLLDLIAQAIYDRKGFNILALDVSKVSSMARYFVIAEGNIDRHVLALSHSISDSLREVGEKPLRVEGLSSGDWTVMDYGDVIIHLFMPEMRERYALEELWKDAEVIDVKIDVEAPVQVRGARR